MKTTVSQRLKFLREQKNVSQTEVAEAIGVTKAAISRLEKGSTPSTENAVKLAKYFGVNLVWLNTDAGSAYSDGRPNPVISSGSEINPWQSEAYDAVKSERDRLRSEVDQLRAWMNKMMEKVSFHKLPIMPGLHNLTMVKGTESGAKAA